MNWLASSVVAGETLAIPCSCECRTHKAQRRHACCVQELRDQLSSVEKKSTTLPKIEQVTPGRVVSASSGNGDTCDGSKRNKETVVSARVEEEKEALVKLREMEEQLLAAKEDSERAAAEVGKMSQDLQDLKEVGRAKQ